MSNGYIRQSSATIVTANTIQASDFNNEYNQLQSAFDATVGHTHGGGTGQGAPIALTSGVTGILPATAGGTGTANNVASTIAITGNFSLGLTLTGITAVTLPTSGTLVNTNVTTLGSLTTANALTSASSLATVGTITTGVWHGTPIAATFLVGTDITAVGTIATGTWHGTVISPTYGGTGVNNGSAILSFAGNVAFSGAFSTTVNVTAGTNVTLPTSGTLLNNTNNLSDVSNVNTALNTLLPSQTSNASKFLSTNGTNTSWTTVAAGFADPGANGIVVRTALNTSTAVTITAGTGISVTNGSGVAGNPTIALSTPVSSTNGGTGQNLGSSTGVLLISSGTVSAGTVSNANGGTGANTSASTGVAQVNSGTWSISTALVNGTTAITQATSDNSSNVATTAFVKSYQPLMTALAVGSLVWCKYNGVPSLSAGSSVAASSLTPVGGASGSGVFTTTGHDTITGTWVALQNVSPTAGSNNDIAQFQRIA